MATTGSTTVQKILDIQVNYSQAIKGIAEYNRQLQEAKTHEQMLTVSKKQGMISEQEYRERMAASRQEVAQINNAKRLLEKTTRNQITAQRAEEGSLQQLRAKLSEATQAYDALSRAERNGSKGRDLQNHINAITAELKGAEQATQRFYRNVGNYKEAQMGLGKLQGSVMSLGKSLLSAFGVGSLLMLGRQIMSVASEFEEAMQRVKAVTNAGTAEMEMMRAEARRLGEQYRFTATQAAEALETLSRGGFSAAEATEALGTTLKMAQANSISLEESADIVIRTLRGFDIAVTQENIEHVGDVLSYASASSATNISEMAEAFKNAAPFSSALGLSVEEVSAALGVLADRGVRGSDAGTAMRMVLLGLAEPTTKAGKVFEKYGIQIDETAIKTEGLSGVLKTLNESGIMKSKESISELAAIFGRRAVTNVMSLMGSLDEFNTKLTDITGDDSTVSKASGKLDQMFEDMNQSFTTKVYTLKSAWESLILTVWDGNNIEAEYQKQVAQLEAKKNEALEGLEKAFYDDHTISEDEFKEQVAEVTQQYNDAKEQLAESTSEQLENAPEGLSDYLADIVTAITDGIRFVRENFNELVTLIGSVIAGFSLQKLISNVRTSAATMKTTLISNAEAASARVNQLSMQEVTQRRNAETLKLAAARETGAQRQLLLNQATIAEAQANQTSVQLAKAKAVEIKTSQEAAAMATTTGWKGAMMGAGLAVKGFVTTAKTAMKSFAPMLVISLVIELVMKLWEALNSGKGPIGNIGKSIGSFIKNSLQKLIQVIVDVINWFIEFYNDSIVVRAGIAYLGGVFKAVWAILKAGIRGIGNSFKLLGGIIAGVANTLKSLFTLDFSGVKAGIAQIGTAVTNFYKNQIDNAKEAGNEIVEGFVSSFNGLDEKIEKVSLNSPGSGDKPSGSGRAGGTGSGGGVGTENADDLGGGGGSATGGKGGRGGRGGNDVDKEKRDAEKREKELNKVYEEAEKELQKLQLELMGETAEKRKQKIIDQYNNEKKTIEQKLAETKKLLDDPKLTADQRKLAEEAVKNWEAALAKIPDAQKKALDLWEMEEKDRQAKLQQELAKAELDNIKVNGEEQLNKRLELQKKQQAQQELMEENALKKRLMSAEITEEQYNALLTQLKEKHRQQEKQIEEKHIQDLNALRKKALQDRINAIKESQSEEEAVRFLARTKALYGSEEYYQAELDHLKGAKKEELTATYEAATSRLEQLRTEGNERLAAIDEQGRLEEETEAEFQARRRAAMDEYMSSRMATDTEFATQVQDADKALAEARLEIDNAMIEQQLANLSDKEAALLRAQYESASQSLQMLEERGKLENQTQAEYDAELVAAKQEKLNAIMKINDAQVKNEQAKAQAMKAVTQSLTQLLDQLGDENSAFAKLSKIITLAQIAIDTGRALSAGIASASSLRFPANLPAIATTVATILANMATAISTVKSAKFATGGKVSGPGTGTSDSIPAMLSNGEFVVNARSTALFEPLLTAMNNIGRGIPMQVANSYQPVSAAEMMTASFTDAAQEIRPVVSVVDVTDMQNKVEVIQNLDTF